MVNFSWLNAFCIQETNLIGLPMSPKLALLVQQHDGIDTVTVFKNRLSFVDIPRSKNIQIGKH